MVRLSDLPGAVRACEWSENCGRSHQHFALKVKELEGLWDSLRTDVEGLFMQVGVVGWLASLLFTVTLFLLVNNNCLTLTRTSQAPSIDLDALGGQLIDREGLLEEQGSIVQVGKVPCLCVAVTAYKCNLLCASCLLCFPHAFLLSFCPITCTQGLSEDLDTVRRLEESGVREVAAGEGVSL